MGIELRQSIVRVFLKEMLELFSELNRQEMTIFLVQHNVQQVLRISDRAYILYQGEIVFHDTAPESFK